MGNPIIEAAYPPVLVPSDTPSLGDVYSCFESLGNNCEFGILRRKAGIDPPGLFRNAGFLQIQQISRAISRNLDGMFEEGNFDFSLPTGWSDWQLACRVFGFAYHSTIPATVEHQSPEWVIQTQRMIKVFRYLVQRLREDLQEGNKIFVYRTVENLTRSKVQELLSALQMHGRNALFVVRQDGFLPSGSVEFAGGGLVLGTVERLSNENPPFINVAAWDHMCRTIIAHREKMWDGDQILYSNIVRADALPNMDPDLRPGMIRHSCRNSDGVATTVYWLELSDVEEGAIITASAWVYLPHGFEQSRLDLVIYGLPTESCVVCDAEKIGTWQLLSTQARVAPGHTKAFPALLITPSEPCVVYSADWKIRVACASEAGA